MSDLAFSKGLHDLGGGNWAYLQPDGSWGWSNAGLIVDGEESLLVDTLFDLPLTATMLRTMRDAVPAAKRIDTLVNTHANGDHTFGNQLVDGARIVTSRTVETALEHDTGDRILGLIESLPPGSDGGRFIRKAFGPFDFHGIVHPPVTDSFTGEHELKVGDKRIRLIDVGPAHTASDLLVHAVDDGVVYTGDILFVGGHPAIWAGPVSNWIKACDLILSWDVTTIVPGHGPIVGKEAVRDFRSYLEYLHGEVRRRYDAGMPWQEAAFDIAFGPFAKLCDPERTVINTLTLYREFSGVSVAITSAEIWELMGRYHYRERAREHACAGHDHAH